MLEIRDPIHLRWYGFMFLLTFVVGQWILKRLARARFLPLPEDRVTDLIFWLVLGVIVGGRVGYCLFYSPEILEHPLDALKLWQGGLSFHGGLLGVCVTLVLFARKHRLPLWRLGDACAIGTPPGIVFVRTANFINGELYGRPADPSMPWAMRFPTEPRAYELLGVAHRTTREKELAVRKAVHGAWEGMPDWLQRVPDWDAVKAGVPLRHPSQIYEALGEGVLVGLVLLALYLATKRRPLAPGSYGAVFLLGYGGVRFFLEYFRQPDKQFERHPGELGTVWLGLSMGQLLCIAMVVAGGVILALSRRPADAEAARAG
jgi:phosphatidylglycerol:prolipoprotein diacylglycerol transferase